MKIIVIGTVLFSLKMLERLQQSEAEIVGVIAGEQQGINADYADLRPFCEAHGIPCFSTRDINATRTIDWVRSKKADVIFCLGWSRLIDSSLLQLAPRGCIGYHPAALPRNRGRHPLIWALVLGLKETASTFFLMDEETDSGDLLSQKVVQISAEDDATSLYQKMVDVAGEQLAELLYDLENGTYRRIPQGKVEVNHWRKRGKQDGEIDWRMSAQSIHNLVRGLARPYVGAHMVVNGNEYKIWKSRVVEMIDINHLEPGKVLQVREKQWTIKCGSGCIELLEVEPPPSIEIGAYL